MTHICPHCQKQYSSRQSKSRHVKSCKSNPNDRWHTIDNMTEKIFEEEPEKKLCSNAREYSFGMENTSILTIEDLDATVRKPYRIVFLLLKKLYITNNNTVRLVNNVAQIKKKKKWVNMNKKDCLYDMIDRSYNLLDMHFAINQSRFSDYEKEKYVEFQQYFDDHNEALHNKLYNDTLSLFIHEISNSPSVTRNLD